MMRVPRSCCALPLWFTDAWSLVYLVLAVFVGFYVPCVLSIMNLHTNAPSTSALSLSKAVRPRTHIASINIRPTESQCTHGWLLSQTENAIHRACRMSAGSRVASSSRPSRTSGTSVSDWLRVFAHCCCVAWDEQNYTPVCLPWHAWVGL